MIQGLLAFILTYTSCSDDQESNDDVLTEEAVDTTQSTLEEKYFMGQKVPVRKEKNGTYSLGGSDIHLFETQVSDSPQLIDENPTPGDGKTRLAIAGFVRKWPGNTIYYVIDGLSAVVRSELQKSFDEWSSKTNIRFVERTNEANYVTILNTGENGNFGIASLGMNGSNGFIRLGTGATAFIIIHEIGHTLGYIHEHNRSDRDDFIRINFDNVDDGAEDQFFKNESAILVTNQFDINSTMMYGSFTFTKNGKPTITDLNGNLLPQGQAQISTLDVEGTNQLYPTGGSTEVSCADAQEFSPTNNYGIGDRVVFEGNLYERDFTEWVLIKQC